MLRSAPLVVPVAVALIFARWLRRAASRQELLRQWAVLKTPTKHDTQQFTIRLPAEHDPEVSDLNSLSELKERIVALELPALLSREWHNLPASFFSRACTWLQIGTTFNVMQFNLLAEGLSSGPDAAPPFPALLRSDHGGFDAVVQKEVALKWKLRKLRLLEEVLRYMPDLLTVQECDHFDDLLLPGLRLAGYDGVFAPKRQSPCIDYGFHSDGVAVLWRTSVFQQLGVERRVFVESDGTESSRPFLLVSRHHLQIIALNLQRIIMTPPTTTSQGLQSFPSAGRCVHQPRFPSPLRCCCATWHLKLRCSSAVRT